MALYIEVTNNHPDGSIGRAGYSFKQGQTKTVKVAASRANELLDAAMLSCVITGADSFAEIPQGYNVQANATDSAQKLASEKGIDLFSIDGSGKDGQVTKADVERYEAAAGEAVKTDRDHYMDLHIAGGGSASATTLDPHDEQLAAQHEALEELEKAEAELRAAQPGSQDSDQESPPSQISEEGLPVSSPSPPADVARNDELQDGVNPGTQAPKES